MTMRVVCSGSEICSLTPTTLLTRSSPNFSRWVTQSKPFSQYLLRPENRKHRWYSETCPCVLEQKACDLRDRKLGFFRLRPLEEEFDFTTEEQLDESRRFRLLQLRNCRAPGTVSSKLVPLHDRDITENMLQVTNPNAGVAALSNWF